MFTRIGRRVTEQNLIPGDHIYVRRHGGVYAHHGIYVGADRVIHYTDRTGFAKKRTSAIVETCLHEFCEGGELRLVNHRLREHRDTTLLRAREGLSEQKYHLVWNNCEHFAAYCCTGRRSSEQVMRFVASTVLIGVGSIILGRRII